MRHDVADDTDRLMRVMDVAFDPCWGEGWTRRQVVDSLATGHCRYRLVGENGTKARAGEIAAGFTLSRLIAGETELLLFAVDPRVRRRGIGAILLEDLVARALADGAHRLFLEMRKGNPAERLYRRFGFEPVGERAKYYRTTSGERIDAVTFARIP